MMMFGDTARKGPRTGVIEIDDSLADNIANELVSKFEPCGSSGLVKPVPITTSAVVHDAATGTARPVLIFVGPDDTESLQRAFYHIKLQMIMLKPKADLCMQKETWRNWLRFTLRHELSHAASSHITTVNPIVAADPRAEPWDLLDQPRQLTPGEIRSYMNHPEEVQAYLAMVHEELTTWLSNKSIRCYSPKDLLIMSETWHFVAPKLTPKNRRRFLRLAAILWQR